MKKLHVINRHLAQIIFVLIIILILFAISPSQIIFAADNLWTPTGPYGVMIRSLTISPNNNQIIYAGAAFSQTSIYKSVDSGTTWSASSNGIPAYSTSYGFAFDPNNPNFIYVATDNGLYKSIDAGASWGLKSSTQINGIAGTLIPWGITTSPVDGSLYLSAPCSTPPLLQWAPVWNISQQ